MSYLVFVNDGEIDPRMFKTFGVSAKDSDGAIGFFGTGLKYAISIILSRNGEIHITSGNDTYTFSKKSVELRNKEFDFICCNEEELSFTTDVGKNWKVWMAYRELWSNTLDESGHKTREEEIVPESGKTKIYVKLKQIDEAEINHDRIFLNRPLIASVGKLNIYEGNSNSLFCKGVAVMSLENTSKFTYELNTLKLTEDRTVSRESYSDFMIYEPILELKDKRLIKEILVASDPRKDTFESDFSYHYGNISSEFLDVASEFYKKDVASISHGLVEKLYKNRRGEIRDEISLTEFEQKKVKRALDFCEKLNFSAKDYKIIFVQTLGSTVLAEAVLRENSIVVSKRCLTLGTAQLASMFIEEIIHLREGLKDCTRELQTYLFDKIVEIGSELHDEVL